MKNVYDDVVVLDYNGGTQIELPDWFAAHNKDFRYQLTAIGAPEIFFCVGRVNLWRSSAQNYFVYCSFPTIRTYSVYFYDTIVISGINAASICIFLHFYFII